MENPMIWVLISPLIALLFGMVSEKVREAIQAFCEKLSGVIEGLYQFSKDALKKSIAWLKLTETPRPDRSFWGLLLLAIAVSASVAEYRINGKTITVIFPWGEDAPILAFALVALTAATGIMSHLAEGGLRKAARVLAALLIATQGTLAAIRTIETLEAEAIVKASGWGGVNNGGLFIDGQVDADFPPSKETAMTPPKWRLIFHPTAILATLTAMFLSTAAVLTFWGGTRFGGSTLPWLLGGVGLVIWAVPTAFLFVLHLIVLQDRLTRAILAITDVIVAICRLPLRAIAWLNPKAFRQRQQEQRQAKTLIAAKTTHDQLMADDERAHRRTMQQLQFKQEREPLENQIAFDRAHDEARLEMQRGSLNLMREVVLKTAETLKAEFDAEVGARAPRYIAHVATVIFDYILSLFNQLLSHGEDSAFESGTVNPNPHKRKEPTDELHIHSNAVDAPASADD